MDDEEEMLYGDSNASAAPAKEEISRSSAALATSGSEGSSSKAEPTHWCMIIRENGVMEVWHTCNIYRYSGFISDNMGANAAATLNFFHRR